MMLEEFGTKMPHGTGAMSIEHPHRSNTRGEKHTFSFFVLTWI